MPAEVAPHVPLLIGGGEIEHLVRSTGWSPAATSNPGLELLTKSFNIADLEKRIWRMIGNG